MVSYAVLFCFFAGGGAGGFFVAVGGKCSGFTSIPKIKMYILTNAAYIYIVKYSCTHILLIIICITYYM